MAAPAASNTLPQSWTNTLPVTSLVTSKVTEVLYDGTTLWILCQFTDWNQNQTLHLTIDGYAGTTKIFPTRTATYSNVRNPTAYWVDVKPTSPIAAGTQVRIDVSVS